MENRYPIAYLTEANCFFMKHPTEVSIDGTPRYIPNPNADATYSMKVCEDGGYVPVYDQEYIDLFLDLKELTLI